MEPAAYRVWIEDVAPRHLVVARGRATTAELPARILALATMAWDAVRAGAIPTTGHNVVLYPLAAAGNADRHEFPLEAGADLLAPTERRRSRRGSATPSPPEKAQVERWSVEDELLAADGWNTVRRPR